VELGGIEPPSVDGWALALRPFPSLRLLAAAPPGRLGPKAPPRGLSPGSAFFHAVSGLSLRSPLLLLPGCSGLAPRAVTGRDDSLLPD